MLTNIDRYADELLNEIASPQALKILLLLVLGIPVVRILAARLERAVARRISAQQGMVLSKIVLYGGYSIIALTVFRELGFSLTPFLGAAGIAGVAIGFASQTSVSNVISGMFLIAEKPFEIGDTIAVGATTGTVLAIDVFSVKLRTADNRFVRIPNETLLKSEVVNATRFPIRRVEIVIGVGYSSRLHKVRSILLDIAESAPLCLQNPPASVQFTDFQASAINVQYVFWTRSEDAPEVRSSMIVEINERFRAEGIDIPFPQVGIASLPEDLMVLRTKD